MKYCKNCGKVLIKKKSKSVYCNIDCYNAVRKGRPCTWGDKISKSEKGKVVSEETRKRIGLAGIGKKQSKETIES